MRGRETSATCGDVDQSPVENSMKKTVKLPLPESEGHRSLEESLAARRLVREFADESLTSGELSQLLWAAQRVTDGDGLRTAPSAGALYPLELYVAISTGLYKYVAVRHQLIQWQGSDVRGVFRDAALEQDAVAEAPAVFVIMAVYTRTQRRYGPRTERYFHMEAGRAAQNLRLEAVALDLGGVPIAAFDDLRVSRMLRLPEAESPLYLIPIGHPTSRLVSG